MKTSADLDIGPTEKREDEFYDKRAVEIPTDVLRSLSDRNTPLILAHIILEWSVIFGAIVLCTHSWHLWLYAMAVLCIGARQHALAILMHDGTHYLLAKNKTVNDWLSDLFLAWPLTITTSGFRSTHWAHHKYTNTEKDPDCIQTIVDFDAAEWEYPTTWRRLCVLMLKDLTGIGFYEFFKVILMNINKSFQGPQSRSAQIASKVRIVLYVTFIGCAIAFGFWKTVLLFWVVPLITVFHLLLHIRVISEHFATEGDHPLNITRTTLPSWWERFFFAKNINLHIAHHLYPSVPFFRLPELHHRLMAQPAFREKAHVTQTYVGFLNECVNSHAPKKGCLPVDVYNSFVATHPAKHPS